VHRGSFEDLDSLRRGAAVVNRVPLETSAAGVRYRAVAEEGKPLREIASVIGRCLTLPVVSKTREEANQHFAWFAQLATADLPASSAWSETVGWAAEAARTTR